MLDCFQLADVSAAAILLRQRRGGLTEFAMLYVLALLIGVVVVLRSMSPSLAQL